MSTTHPITRGSLWTERDHRFLKRTVEVEGSTNEKPTRIIIRTVVNERGEPVQAGRTSKVKADVFRKRFIPKP